MEEGQNDVLCKRFFELERGRGRDVVVVSRRSLGVLAVVVTVAGMVPLPPLPAPGPADEADTSEEEEEEEGSMDEDVLSFAESVYADDCAESMTSLEEEEG